MPLYLTTAGKLLLTASGKAVLFATAGVAVPPPPAPPLPAVSLLSTVAGMSAWWDAGTTTDVLAGAGYVSLRDKTGNGLALGATGGVGSSYGPRLVGTLGGIGYPRGAPNYSVQLPTSDPAGGWAASVPVAANGDLTVFLAWSRPNLLQVTGPTNTPAPLLAINGTTVLDMTATPAGTGDTLRLFPNGTVRTGGSLTIRHTHSARVVFASGLVDVWLDGAKVIAGAASGITLSGTAAVALLPGAGCWLHEAGTWPRALSAADQAQLTLCAGRWPGSDRRAANGFLIGQSNAGYFISSAVAFAPLSQGICYWTGHLSSSIIGNGAGTLFSGQGVYGAGTIVNDALFLQNAGDNNPATWAYGANGRTFAATVAATSAADMVDLTYIAWMWSESDSLNFTYADKTVYEAAIRRAFQLIRATCGRTAAQLPVLMIDAMPFQPGPGCQMHREVSANIAADAAMNVSYMLDLSTDAIGLPDTVDTATGLEAGPGDGAHSDNPTFQGWAQRMALPIAAAVLLAEAARTSDLSTALPSGIVPRNGPRVVSAHYEGSTSVLVTLTHNNGTDLRLPLRAALGIGWSVMDGGTETTPGAIVLATAAVRVDATHIRLTLASALTNAGTAHLYYGRGNNIDPVTKYRIIGRGNAVTDNYSATALAGLGVPVQPDMPLGSTKYGMLLT